ncbi:MAG: ion transporter [Chloroflexi bacterium]|nr:MAG: ion transporter [Chloroflexota bacterium]
MTGQNNSSTNPPQKSRSSTYDLFILALTLISLATTVIIIVPGFGYAAASVAVLMDTLISLIFLFDFASSLYMAPNKREYLRWGWMDLLGSLPALPALRVFRIWRLVRAVRILRKTSPAELLRTVVNRPAESSLLVTVLFAILLVGFASYFILLTELEAPGANITSVIDAIWWVLVTVTTVGYGDRYPVTLTGRLIAIVVMLSGIGLFTILTSYLSSSFVSASNDAAEADLAQLKTELAKMRQMLQQLLDDREQNRPAA